MTTPIPCPAADGSSPTRREFDGPPPMCIDTSKRYTATMVTTKGTLTIALDPIGAPLTTNNFVVLARYHYFDGIVFHRIIPGFVLPGRGPDGHRPGRSRLPVRGRAAGARPLRARFAGHGQRRSEHQRQPVLRHQRAVGGGCRRSTRCSARWSPAWTWSRPSMRIGTQSGTPNEEVTIESVTIAESD